MDVKYHTFIDVKYHTFIVNSPLRSGEVRCPMIVASLTLSLWANLKPEKFNFVRSESYKHICNRTFLEFITTQTGTFKNIVL